MEEAAHGLLIVGRESMDCGADEAFHLVLRVEKGVEAPQVRPEAQSEPHVSEERRPAQGTKFPINTKRRVSEESRREGDS